MIVLDTIVVSEVMKSEPNPTVINWLNAQHAQSLFLTTVSVAELRYGVERLPEGKRKSSLWVVLEFTMRRLFGMRILPFDQPAAEEAARIAAATEAAGEKVGFADRQVAAIARANGFAVATRDVRPFAAAAVDVVNPWDWRIAS